MNHYAFVETNGVEAGDQVRDGIPGASAGGEGGLLVVVATGYGQEHGGPRDLGGGCGLGSAEQSQDRDLVVGQRPGGSFLRRDMPASV